MVFISKPPHAFLRPSNGVDFMRYKNNTTANFSDNKLIFQMKIQNNNINLSPLEQAIKDYINQFQLKNNQITSFGINFAFINVTKKFNDFFSFIQPADWLKLKKEPELIEPSLKDIMWQYKNYEGNRNLNLLIKPEMVTEHNQNQNVPKEAVLVDINISHPSDFFKLDNKNTFDLNKIFEIVKNDIVKESLNVAG